MVDTQAQMDVYVVDKCICNAGHDSLTFLHLCLFYATLAIPTPVQKYEA